jgi:exonuclease VII small subunit
VKATANISTREKKAPSTGRSLERACEELERACEELERACEELERACEELERACEELVLGEQWVSKEIKTTLKRQ